MKPKMARKPRPTEDVSSPPLSPTAASMVHKKRRIDSGSLSPVRKMSTTAATDKTAKLSPTKAAHSSPTKTAQHKDHTKELKHPKEERQLSPLAPLRIDDHEQPCSSRAAETAVRAPPEFLPFDYARHCPTLDRYLRSEEALPTHIKHHTLRDLQYELEAMLAHTMDFMRRAAGDLRFLETGEYPTVNLKNRQMPVYTLKVFPTSPLSPTAVMHHEVSLLSMLIPRVAPVEEIDVWPPPHMGVRYQSWQAMEREAAKIDKTAMQEYIKFMNIEMEELRVDATKVNVPSYVHRLRWTSMHDLFATFEGQLHARAVQLQQLHAGRIMRKSCPSHSLWTNHPAAALGAAEAFTRTYSSQRETFLMERRTRMMRVNKHFPHLHIQNYEDRLITEKREAQLVAENDELMKRLMNIEIGEEKAKNESSKARGKDKKRNHKDVRRAEPMHRNSGHEKEEESSRSAKKRVPQHENCPFRGTTPSTVKPSTFRDVITTSKKTTAEQLKHENYVIVVENEKGTRRIMSVNAAEELVREDDKKKKEILRIGKKNVEIERDGEEEERIVEERERREKEARERRMELKGERGTHVEVVTEEQIRKRARRFLKRIKMVKSSSCNSAAAAAALHQQRMKEEARVVAELAAAAAAEAAAAAAAEEEAAAAAAAAAQQAGRRRSGSRKKPLNGTGSMADASPVAASPAAAVGSRRNSRRHEETPEATTLPQNGTGSTKSSGSRRSLRERKLSVKAQQSELPLTAYLPPLQTTTDGDEPVVLQQPNGCSTTRRITRHSADTAQLPTDTPTRRTTRSMMSPKGVGPSTQEWPVRLKITVERRRRTRSEETREAKRVAVRRRAESEGKNGQRENGPKENRMKRNGITNTFSLQERILRSMKEFRMKKEKKKKTKKYVVCVEKLKDVQSLLRGKRCRRRIIRACEKKKMSLEFRLCLQGRKGRNQSKAAAQIDLLFRESPTRYALSKKEEEKMRKEGFTKQAQELNEMRINLPRRWKKEEKRFVREEDLYRCWLARKLEEKLKDDEKEVTVIGKREQTNGQLKWRLLIMENDEVTRKVKSMEKRKKKKKGENREIHQQLTKVKEISVKEEKEECFSPKRKGRKKKQLVKCEEIRKEKEKGKIESSVKDEKKKEHVKNACVLFKGKKPKMVDDMDLSIFFKKRNIKEDKLRKDEDKKAVKEVVVGLSRMKVKEEKSARKVSLPLKKLKEMRILKFSRKQRARMELVHLSNKLLNPIEERLTRFDRLKEQVKIERATRAIQKGLRYPNLHEDVVDLLRNLKVLEKSANEQNAIVVPSIDICVPPLNEKRRKGALWPTEWIAQKVFRAPARQKRWKVMGWRKEEKRSWEKRTREFGLQLPWEKKETRPAMTSLKSVLSACPFVEAERTAIAICDIKIETRRRVMELIYDTMIGYKVDSSKTCSDEEEDYPVDEDEVAMEMVVAQREFARAKESYSKLLVGIFYKMAAYENQLKSRKLLEEKEDVLYKLHAKYYREVPLRLPNEEECEEIEEALTERRIALERAYGSNLWKQPMITDDHPAWLTAEYKEGAKHQKNWYDIFTDPKYESTKSLAMLHTTLFAIGTAHHLPEGEVYTVMMDREDRRKGELTSVEKREVIRLMKLRRDQLNEYVNTRSRRLRLLPKRPPTSARLKEMEEERKSEQRRREYQLKEENANIEQGREACSVDGEDGEDERETKRQLEREPSDESAQLLQQAVLQHDRSYGWWMPEGEEDEPEIALPPLPKIPFFRNTGRCKVEPLDFDDEMYGPTPQPRIIRKQSASLASTGSRETIYMRMDEDEETTERTRRKDKLKKAHHQNGEKVDRRKVNGVNLPSSIAHLDPNVFLKLIPHNRSHKKGQGKKEMLKTLMLEFARKEREAAAAAAAAGACPAAAAALSPKIPSRPQLTQQQLMSPGGTIRSVAATSPWKKVKKDEEEEETEEKEIGRRRMRRSDMKKEEEENKRRREKKVEEERKKVRKDAEENTVKRKRGDRVDPCLASPPPFSPPKAKRACAIIKKKLNEEEEEEDDFSMKVPYTPARRSGVPAAAVNPRVATALSSPASARAAAAAARTTVTTRSPSVISSAKAMSPPLLIRSCRKKAPVKYNDEDEPEFLSSQPTKRKLKLRRIKEEIIDDGY